MQYVLGNMLNGGGGLNADGLALDLQFALDKTLTARKGPTPVFTRASSGTFVGSNGLIQSAATNIPRFDHTSAGVCRGLLIEGSRTNVALYSGAWVAGAGWGSNTNSVPSGTGPDGNTAYEISESTTLQTQTAGNTGGTTSTSATSVTSGTTYTGSAFVKKVAGNIDWIQIALGSGGFGNNQYANINLSNGTIGNSSGGTARIEPFANGWYRVSFTATATRTTATSISVVVGFIQNTNGTVRFPTYSGNPANKFLATMAQFETGSFPTSYIPTTTSSVVRSADVCSITGANFTSFWNANEGSTFVNAISSGRGSGAFGNASFFMDIAATASTINRLSQFATGGGATRPEIKNLNVDQYSPTALSYTANTNGKQSTGFKVGETSSAFLNNNAFTGGTNIALTMPSVTELHIGHSSLTGNYCNGPVAAIRYYKKRLPNAKLQALTA